jgi:hypothetical protein
MSTSVSQCLELPECATQSLVASRLQDDGEAPETGHDSRLMRLNAGILSAESAGKSVQ